MGGDRTGHPEGAGHLPHRHLGLLSYGSRRHGSRLQERPRQPGFATTVRIDGRRSIVERRRWRRLPQESPSAGDRGIDKVRATAVLAVVLLLAAIPARAEDGYDLWLRYQRVEDAARLRRYQDVLVRQLVVGGQSPTMRLVSDELIRGFKGLIGVSVPVAADVTGGGAIVAGTPANSPFIARLALASDLAGVGSEGYLIRSLQDRRGPVTVIAANTDTGVLYGAFHLLRLIQTNSSIEGLAVAEHPRIQHRILDHWDNLDGSVERGYAGRSLWDWFTLPDYKSPRYTDYARANASLGVNGTVLTNVNANATSLTRDYLVKAAALAEVFRPFGIRVYLTARFSAPIEIGGLKTADPLSPEVRKWWAAKADEIYKLIPDFGGFLVKANSEGQPGPQDYKRTHADGANMLADAVAPHKGNVIWRAFVYDEDVDADRLKRAFIEFTRLDGQFRPNVAVQVKNGALDFQPREPFHPLFGALKETPIIAEIQPSQEYLGHAKHLVYLGTQWEQFLKSDTHAKGTGSTIAKVLAGQVQPSRITGMASVVNPGLDANWCGHHFSQANWYACGRLSWNPELSAAQIADEWTRMTFSNDDKVVAVIHQMMMSSHETFVNYTM